jgi:hypothetical protein
MVASADQAYLAMLGDVVAPVLGEFGFIRSGELFCVDREDVWARLGFQASHPDACSVSFTINAWVVARTEWRTACLTRNGLP